MLAENAIETGAEIGVSNMSQKTVEAAMDSGTLAHGGEPARIEAMTASGATHTVVFSLGLLEDPNAGAAGTVAVIRAGGEPISFV
jgi:hypothetical protein